MGIDDTKLAIREQLFEVCQRELRASVLELAQRHRELLAREAALSTREQALLQDADGSFYGMHQLLQGSELALQRLEADLRESRAHGSAVKLEAEALRQALEQAEGRHAELVAVLRMEETSVEALRGELLELSELARDGQAARLEADRAGYELERARGLLTVYKRQLAESRERVRIMVQAGEPYPRGPLVTANSRLDMELGALSRSYAHPVTGLPSSDEIRSRKQTRFLLSVVAAALMAVWLQTGLGGDLLRVFTSTARVVQSSVAVTSSAGRGAKPHVKVPNQETANRVR